MARHHSNFFFKIHIIKANTALSPLFSTSHLPCRVVELGPQIWVRIEDGQGGREIVILIAIVPRVWSLHKVLAEGFDVVVKEAIEPVLHARHNP